MNLAKYQNKLLRALQYKGLRVAVNAINVWSDMYNKYLCKYEVIVMLDADEYEQQTGKKPKGQMNKVKVLESYSRAEVVKKLSEMYKEMIEP